MKSANQIIKKMFRGSLTVMILSAITATIGMIIDGVLTGSFLGMQAMAAYGIVMPAFIVLTGIGGVLASGLQTVCAKKMGQGKMDEANGAFSLTLIAGTILSLVIALAFLCFAQPLAQLLGASGDNAYLLGDAKDYLIGISFCIPALILSNCLQPIMQLDSDKARAFLSVIVMTVVNVIGDILVIFVFHGGMLGMALATTVSYYAGLAVLVLHFFKKESMYRFSLQRLCLKPLWEIISIGLPTAMNRVCNTLRMMALNHLLLAVGGGIAVAAFSVQSNMNNLFGSVGMGVGMATLMLAGVVVGEEDRASTRELFKTALTTGFLLVGAVAALLFTFAPFTVDMYVRNDPATRELAIDSIRLFALSMPFHVISLVYINYLQGSKNVTLAHIITLLCELVLVLIPAYLLSSWLGATGVWVAFSIGRILTIMTWVGIVWFRTKKFPRKLDDFLLLPENFDVADSDKMEESILNMEEVIAVSEKAHNFCVSKGVEEKRAYYVALCIEEMAGNIIRYGFSDGKKHNIYLRLLYKGDQLILRIRNDCDPFDPKKWLAIHKPEDPCANVGIRMVNSIAKRFDYINTMGTNNLIIRL